MKHDVTVSDFLRCFLNGNKEGEGLIRIVYQDTKKDAYFGTLKGFFDADNYNEMKDLIVKTANPCGLTGIVYLQV